MSPVITNEMKAALMDEFLFDVTAECVECIDLGLGDEDCPVCGGHITYQRTVTVPWYVCKAIYKKMSQHSPSPVVPNEQGTNRYGLDMAYFRNLFNRELNHPLTDFRPDELARVLARASRTADSSVMHEPEFKQDPT